MGLLGTILLFFLIIHLPDFWYQLQFGRVPLDKDGQKDLYKLVIRVYQNGWYVLIYVLGMVALGYHLWDGFFSAARTLGFYNARYVHWVRAAGWVYSLGIEGYLATVRPYVKHIFKPTCGRFRFSALGADPLVWSPPIECIGYARVSTDDQRLWTCNADALERFKGSAYETESFPFMVFPMADHWPQVCPARRTRRRSDTLIQPHRPATLHFVNVITQTYDL
jgi:hypothetical protein